MAGPRASWSLSAAVTAAHMRRLKSRHTNGVTIALSLVYPATGETA